MIDTHLLDLMMGDEWRENLPPICLECGYNLTGLVSNRCPECGAYFSMREVRRFVQSLRIELLQINTVQTWVRTGFTLAVAAAVLLVAGWCAGKLWFDPLAGVSRFMSGLLAFPACCLALNVLRVFRLPSWARPWMKVEPPFQKAGMTILIGLATIAAAFLLP